MSKSVAIFGSTGSIGTQTLEVISRYPDQYRVLGLVAHSNVSLLLKQVELFSPEYVVLNDNAAAAEVKGHLSSDVELLTDADALAELAKKADISVNGIVGFAGLPVTLSCLQAGKRLALANKESLIAAGPIVQKARKVAGAELIPVDSEHAAIHQCLRANTNKQRVSRLQLTASGGPFRGWSSEQLKNVDREEALQHPTWSMGPKITVDSSTLMNKGLEVIEANELFGKPAGVFGYDIDLSDIEVVVHPQSIVHSMVTYADGSTLAKLSDPDMRLPIGYALAYPDRLDYAYGSLDWSAARRLEFEPPDREAFPCLQLAYEAAAQAGSAPAVLSAANEIAVEAFLNDQIPWVDIYKVNERVLLRYATHDVDTVEDVLHADAEARRLAFEEIQR